MKKIEQALYAPLDESEKKPSEKDWEIWRAFVGSPIYAIVRATGIKQKDVIASCRRASYWSAFGYGETKSRFAVMQLRAYHEGNKQRAGLRKIDIEEDHPSSIYRNAHELTLTIKRIRRLAYG